MNSWWLTVEGREILQGDMLPNCLFPQFEGLIGEVGQDPEEAGDHVVEEFLVRASVIVMTQSCDLVNDKASFVALCPVISLQDFASVNTHYKKTGNWEEVRRGKKEGLHMIASPVAPEDNMKSLVVDFGQIVSLPIDYLQEHAASLGERYRLDSPYLEHFSQAFARFFMRVGLPSTIEPFKGK